MFSESGHSNVSDGGSRTRSRGRANHPRSADVYTLGRLAVDGHNIPEESYYAEFSGSR